MKSWWNLIFVLVAVAVVFSTALHHAFVKWDDDVHCYDNPNVRVLDLNHVRTIFTTDVNKTYIPLTIFSFALEYHFFKDNPLIYHLDNVLLHMGVVALIYFLAMRLGFSSRAAALGALLFGIHPMHVESVAWVTQRKDVLYSLFYLLSCWHYVCFLRGKRRESYLWAILFGFLSILAKPMALSLPFILCLLDWYVRGIKRPFLIDKIPFALIIFPIAWVTYQMNMRPIHFEIPESPLVWMWSLGFYLSKFLFPHKLLALYQLPMPVSLENPAFILAICVVVVFAGVLFYMRRHKFYVFACLYFLLSIFFLLRFDNKQDLSFVADRFMYLPSMAFCVLFGHWMDRAHGVWQQRPLLRKALIGLIAAGYLTLGFWAYRQVRLWGDEYLLWSRVAQNYPSSAAAYNQLGNYFLAQRDYAQALTYFDNVILLDPKYHKAYGNRGVVHLQERNYDAAIADFTIVIALNPNDSALAYNNRGYAYLQERDLNAALADFHKAIALDPQNFKAYMNRATVYKDRGDWDMAMRDLISAQKVDPDDQSVRSNIKWLQQRMGR